MLETLTGCSPGTHHRSTPLRRPEQSQQKPDPGGQSGAGPPTKYAIGTRYFQGL
jgi:hypothetical protein